MTAQSAIKAPLNIDAIRAEFPILQREINGYPLRYLDNAASAQKPEFVIESIAGVYRASYANVHRGLHTLANETTEEFEKSREDVRRFLNAPRSEEIVFTRGSTEAINLVAHSFGQLLQQGDEIIISQMEHHSNIVPWRLLADSKGLNLRWAPVTDSGELDYPQLADMVNERTRLIAISHMSNVTGTINDAARIVEIARSRSVPVLLDGSQSAVHLPVDVQALDCDFFVFTGHKLYGPSGIGALYAKGDWLDRLPPYMGGGEMIADVYEDRVTFADVPHKFEAGTPAIADAIGLGAAIRWLERHDRMAVLEHERALMDRAMAGLAEIDGLRVVGTAQDKGAIISFTLDGAHPHDVAQILDKYGVAVRAGHHCAQPLMRRMGVSSTARASFAIYNTIEEADAFVDALKKARDFLI
ncbi:MULTISPECIES: cysteine desulfurase [Maricaulis]|uniref:Cysteine desulfurase n=1 Tax=Maricaulis maris (strain MCS10) TaxID=394221 RepID=Q0AQ26_MARMM|nr:MULTISPECIES: cysteine desulfurase [Maricaulis]ABI65611.1 cysteine desulfurase [Maricaulis maris MCS10]MAC90178.1 cysteine desulfurase [Maricaulis sp.]